MIGKSPERGQKHLFLANLMDFVNPGHRLCLLADGIDWSGFETGFAPLYSKVGCPAKPVRLMVGLLILKQVYNLAGGDGRMGTRTRTSSIFAGRRYFNGSFRATRRIWCIFVTG